MSKNSSIRINSVFQSPTQGGDRSFIPDNSVSSSKLQDLAVTSNKLAEAGTTASKLNADTIPYILKHAKNYIINGAMNFNQRGTSTATTNNTYTLDRWKHMNGIGGATFNYSQQGTSYSGTNSQYCQRIQRTDTGTNAGTLYSTQNLETINATQLLGKTVTLSCKARTNVPANIQLRLTLDYSVTVDDNPVTMSAVSLGNTFFTITSSFVTYNITAVIPSSCRTLAVGTHASFNAVNNQNNYLEVTDVMLNEGSVAAPFQTAGANISEELAMCQRYYEVLVVSAANSNPGGGSLVLANTSTYAEGSLMWKIKKRVAPVLTTSTANLTGPGVTYGAALVNIAGVSVVYGQISTDACRIYTTVSGLAVGQWYGLWHASGVSIYIDAEL